jgi:transposase-like protein
MDRMSHEERRERREEIVKAAMSGKYKRQLMEEFDVEETTVKKACREAGVSIRKHPAGLEEKCFRFARLVSNGASPHVAAIHLDMSPEFRERVLEAAELTGFFEDKD